MFQHENFSILAVGGHVYNNNNVFNVVKYFDITHLSLVRESLLEKSVLPFKAFGNLCSNALEYIYINVLK